MEGRDGDGFAVVPLPRAERVTDLSDRPAPLVSPPAAEGRPPVSSTPPSVLDAAAIMRILPHRPPFLFVDRVEITVPGRSAVGWKAVSANEPYFVGHFPGHPVLPGVLILEAMAQVGGVVLLSLPEFAGRLAYFGGIEQARFRRQVVPGDTLRLEVELTRRLGRVGRARAVATVTGERAAEAVLSFAVAAVAD